MQAATTITTPRRFNGVLVALTLGLLAIIVTVFALIELDGDGSGSATRSDPAVTPGVEARTSEESLTVRFGGLGNDVHDPLEVRFGSPLDSSGQVTDDPLVVRFGE